MCDRGKNGGGFLLCEVCDFTSSRYIRKSSRYFGAPALLAETPLAEGKVRRNAILYCVLNKNKNNRAHANEEVQARAACLMKRRFVEAVPYSM